MGGIALIRRLDGAPTKATDLQRMLDRLRHRGPDAEGVFTQGAVGLGAVLAATTPEAPLADPLVRDGDRVIAADVRLDGRAALGDAVSLDPAGASDERLVLAAYQRFGDDCVRYLIGDFAFVIWDAGRRLVFGARDAFGARPLYCHHLEGRRFIIASQIAALRALPEISLEIDRRRVATYLVPYLSDAERSFFAQVRRIPAAHAFSFDGRRLELHRYWAPCAPVPRPRRDDREHIAAFRTAFEEAVSDRMRSSAPVGAMLSGGLDSTTVVGCADAARARTGASGAMPVFSAVFDDAVQADERRYIDLATARYDVQSTRVHPDAIGPLHHGEALVRALDAPFYAPNIELSWLVYEAARHRGVRVVLDGYDGDSVLQQSPRSLREVIAAGRWSDVWAATEGLAAESGVGRLRALWRQGLRPSLAARWPLRDRTGPAAPADHPWATDPISAAVVIRADFARKVDLAGELERARRSRGKAPVEAAANLAWHLDDGMASYFMEIVDGVASAFSVEPRSPFFDRRVVEASLSLPPHVRRHRGWSRGVLRTAFADILPPRIARRIDKSNLTPVFVRGLRLFETGRVQAALSGRSRLGEFVDLRRLAAAWERVSRDGDPAHALAVWRALSLDLWLRSLD